VVLTPAEKNGISEELEKLFIFAGELYNKRSE
jgi:hypothetical protein